MGILNPKEIVLDTILTTEGRRQIAHSSLKASYYSFTDMGTIYNVDTIASGNLSIGGLPFNETYRLCFEATNLPQDTIVFETDDSGKLNAVPTNLLTNNNNPLTIKAGKIFELTGSYRTKEITNIDTFASLTSDIISSSQNAFKDQMILSSPDPLDNNERNFKIAPGGVKWAITDERPIAKNLMTEANIDSLESLFFDKRLSHVPNFKFLAPINKITTNESSEIIGEYKPLGQPDILKYNPDISNDLKQLDEIGFSETISFLETSKENNLFIQMFETNNLSIGKLDIIDFGEFQEINEDGTTSSKHVFFCGKIYVDNNGTTTYVNMFTIVFDTNFGITSVRNTTATGASI